MKVSLHRLRVSAALLVACVAAQAHAQSAATFEHRQFVRNLRVTEPAPAPSPAPTPAPAAGFSLSSTDGSFGTVTVGQTRTKQWLLSSTGSAALAIASIELTGSTAFQASTTCTALLAPGASCLIEASLSPAGAGPVSATLRLSTNGSPTVYDLALSGQGQSVAPVLQAQAQHGLFAAGTARSVTVSASNVPDGSVMLLGYNGTTTEVTPSSVSASSVQFDVPAGLPAGSYTMTVRTPDGVLSNELSNRLRIWAAPTYSSLSPTSVPAGAQTVVTLSGTNFYNGTGSPEVRFGSSTGTQATAVDVSSSTQLTFTTPASLVAGAYPLHVTLRDSNGNVQQATTSSSLTVYLNEPAGTVYYTGLQLSTSVASNMYLTVNPSDGLACIFGTYLNYRHRCLGVNTSDVSGPGNPPFVQSDGAIAAPTSGANVQHLVAGSGTAIGTYTAYTSAVTPSAISMGLYNPVNGYTYFVTSSRGLVRAQFTGSGYTNAALVASDYSEANGPVTSMSYDPRNGDMYFGTSTGFIVHRGADGSFKRLMNTAFGTSVKGLAVGPTGTVYFTVNGKYAVFATADFSSYTVFAGSPTSTGDVVGAGTTARFGSLHSLGFFGNRLYVAEPGTRKLKYIE